MPLPFEPEKGKTTIILKNVHPLFKKKLTDFLLWLLRLHRSQPLFEKLGRRKQQFVGH